MDTKEEFYNQVFRVVGVTFDNEDGVNRQQLLEDIKMFHGSNGYDYKKGLLDVQLVKYKYNDEDAIKVVVGISQDMIGNISKKDLQFLLENYDYIHDIPNFDVYYGTPYGCSITVTFKNPNYVATEIVVEDIPPIAESIVVPKERKSFLSKLFKK